MYLFTLLLVIAPLLYLIVISFMEKGEVWGVDSAFTLANYARIAEPAYLNTILFSLGMSAAVTAATAAVGYPFGLFMSRLKSDRAKSVLMTLVILPFWTNALVRIYGFIILLRGNGLLYKLLHLLGYGGDSIAFLYTPQAVAFGMIYALLPFMILSVYSSCERLDRSVPEAARDLGAGKIKTFLTVTLPLTADGLISGITLVFIPSMGLFFISDLMGGGKVVILGNLIKNQLLTSRDFPFGAALSVVMLALMVVCLAVTGRMGKRRKHESEAKN